MIDVYSEDDLVTRWVENSKPHKRKNAAWDRIQKSTADVTAQ